MPAPLFHYRVRRESLYHRAVELIGKRWTGAILLVLMDGALHFSEIRDLVPHPGVDEGGGGEARAALSVVA